MKHAILIILMLIPSLGFSSEKRDLLTDKYNRDAVYRFCEYNLDWVKYPAYTDRAAWEAIPAERREATIKAGEKYLGYDWPNVLPSMYLEFTRTGDRAVVDSRISQRLSALRALFFAELVEGKGRFMDDIINGVFMYCEQTYWGSSAHFYLYEYPHNVSNPSTVIPDKSNPIIDLTTGDVTSTLSWVWYFLHEEFDKVSPVINQRFMSEMRKKILDPYYTRNDFWWITGWNKGSVNNWTPWCSYNMLTAILLLETDKEKRINGIYKTMQSVDLFINSYPEDGGCSEGPSYWGAAVGKLYDYLSLIGDWSYGNINIYDNDIIKEMGRYIYKMYVGNGNNYVNFSDAPARIEQDGIKIARYGRDINDGELEGFGLFLAEKSDHSPLSGDVGSALSNEFGYEGRGIGPKEVLVQEAYLPDLQVAVGRDRKDSDEGFFFAAKGGSNGEQHNHNDVGSFILFYDGSPVFIDPGVGTYTRQTFSEDRYGIWTMRSGYHNLPVINGVEQKAGGKYKAADATFKSKAGKVEFSADISGAYPEDAKVSSWVRRYTLQRGKKFMVEDSYSLSGSKDATKVIFMTPLSCTVQNGKVMLAGEGVSLQLSYPAASMDCDVEKVTIDDARLRGVWKEGLRRIVFTVKGSKTKNAVSFEIKEK